MDPVAYQVIVSRGPGRQRSGIGRRMMEALLDEARARNHAYVELESTPAGFALYQSLAERSDLDAIVALAAYAMARNGRLGPWIARAADAAERVFDRALASLGPGAAAYLPVENERALAIAAARGLAAGRRHPHMLWGRKAAVVRPLVYGRITLGQG